MDMLRYLHSLFTSFGSVAKNYNTKKYMAQMKMIKLLYFHTIKTLE